MAKQSAAWNCPQCGVSKGGYRSERAANSALQVHVARRHPAGPRPAPARLLKF